MGGSALGWGSLRRGTVRGRARAAGALVSLVVSVALCVGAAAVWEVERREEQPGSGPATSVIGPPPQGMPAALPREVPRRPAVLLVRDGVPGPVVGPTYGPGMRLTPMRGLRGMPFDFDVPETWGCIGGSKRLRADVVWTCADERGGSRAGGWIGVQSCRAPCRDTEQTGFRTELIGPEPRWRATDPATAFTESPADIDGEPRVRVAMTYAFAADTGGPVDTLAFARLTGPPATLDTLLSLVNEIRLRAGG
ncbi:hypothetical protein SAMN04244553_2773 [Nocardia amikacinitolerans]|uniref:Uncharacterized protein n=1 Tax=Nocardia amikacinitolerans TaxID=756689 RepID=A0A285L8A9_9NOCA|nr:hypothetical protein SAMN04244553_2773 [Nocardia amikacinitolerans]